MANSYENTIMPEKPEENIKPDAIPVDDKGQPLPDPTENLSDYISPKGVEELRKAYSEIEVDEDVRETMEPPQRASFLRKYKSDGKRYSYYGTPASSIPNDNNGIKPSPLTELFEEAEALEPDFDLEKIKNHVLAREPGSEYKVVETPKLERTEIKSDKKGEDDILKRKEVIKDPNAPKFLELYKESTNTKVIYQSDTGFDSASQPPKAGKDAGEIFAEHSRVAKAKKKISKKEEKRAAKAKIKEEKRKAKARKKGKAFDEKKVTSPEEIISLNSRADSGKKQESLTFDRLSEERAAAQKAAEEAKAAREEAEKLKAELEAMKAVAAKAIAQKQRAEKAAKLAIEESRKNKPHSAESASDINGSE